MKTVLVTGAAGFLGRNVTRQFLREGWQVLAVDDVPAENAPAGPGLQFERMKLPDPRLPELLGRTAPEACVHCAGLASVPVSMTEPSADFRANTVLTFELLETLRQHAPSCRFLLLSSAAVYGDPPTLPVSEDHPPGPLSPYGYHKRQAELLCEEYSRIYGLPTASVRIFSAYGPGLRRQVVWDICEKVLTTGRLMLRGTGGESRDFIHAADIAHALHLLAEKAPCTGEIYNLASGRETTIAELAAQLLAALGSKESPTFDGVATPGYPLHWRADVSRISALGFQPSIPLDQGLRAVANWCAAELGAAAGGNSFPQP